MRRLLSMSKLILPWVANKTSFPGESGVWNAFYQEEAAEGVDCLGDILSQSRWGPRPMTEQQAIWEQQEDLWGHSPRSHYESWLMISFCGIRPSESGEMLKAIRGQKNISVWNAHWLKWYPYHNFKNENVWIGNHFKVAIIIFSTWRENIFNSTTTKRR